MVTLSFGSIRPESLNDETLSVYCELMIEVRAVIQRLCQRIYGEDCFRQFRIDYFCGRLHECGISREDHASLEMLQSIQVPILQHMLGMIKQHAYHFWQKNRHRMPGIEVTDFEQEACMAVVECIYNYNGTSKFSTYCFTAIKKRLLDLIRVDTPFSPVSPDILADAGQIRLLMSRERLTLEAAGAKLGLSPDRLYVCTKAMACVVSEASESGTRSSEKALTLEQIAVDTWEEVPDQYDETMMEAFHQANLDPFEREVFKAYLMTDNVGYQSRVSEKYGKTRAAASAAFKRARQKIREKYLELAPSDGPNIAA